MCLMRSFAHAQCLTEVSNPMTRLRHVGLVNDTAAETHFTRAPSADPSLSNLLCLFVLEGCTLRY